MPGDSSQHIPTLRRLRDRLSDLSMRNRSLRLVGLPKKRAFDLAWLDVVHRGDSARVLEQVLKGRRGTTDLLAVGTDDEDAQALHRGLNYLHREVRLVEDERGVYDLSIGVLFLCGTLAEGKYIQAPLFLLPRRLTLDRKHRCGTRWILEPIDDPKEVNVNRTLLLALQKYAGLTLELERLEETAAEVLFGRSRAKEWLQSLAESAATALQAQGLRALPTTHVWGEARGDSEVPGSELVPALPLYKAAEMPTPPPRRFELRPHAVLSRFPLADTALLSDYDDLLRVLEVHPKQPLGYAAALLGDTQGVRAVSHKLPMRKKAPRWHIESTDESQEGVLTQVLGGRSLAVYGPPGTGKSQLIANLVASALAEGKRVLVVSQKRAALDVVAQRMGTELERFVALVHDPVRDRAALMERIIASLAPELGQGGAANSRERKRLLSAIHAQEEWFGRAHEALTEPPPTGQVPFDAYALKLQHPGKPEVLRVRGLPEITPMVLQEAIPELKQLLEDQAWARAPGTWRKSRPDLSVRTEDELESFVDDTLPGVARRVRALIAWDDARPAGMDDVDRTAAKRGAYAELQAWCASTASFEPETWKWAQRATQQDTPAQVVLEDQRRLKVLLRLREAAGGRVLPLDADGADMETLFEAFSANDAAWYRFLLPSWHAQKKQLLARFNELGIDAPDLQEGIEEWRRRASYGRALRGIAGELRVLHEAGLDYRGFAEEQLEACVALAHRGAESWARWRALSREARQLAGGMPKDSAQVEALQAIVTHGLRAPKLVQDIQWGEQALADWVGPAARTWMSASRKARDPSLLELKFADELEVNFDALSSADRRIAQVYAQHPELAKLATLARAQGVEDLEQELWRAYSTRWVRDAEAGRRVLRDLTPAEVQARREKLREAWCALPAANRRLLQATLHDGAAGITMGDRAELTKRAAQRRKRWSVRKLVEKLWTQGLSDLLPVWLCSPETVAAIFPLKPGFFDYVVFDEASQCTLAQGLTAVYRGRTCVIAGDEQQLPPSSLFSTTLEDEDELDEVIDEESLLSRAKAAGADMALSWHYRSRYPELIQFSNETFYHGALRVSPVPVTGFSSPSLEWMQVDGEWTKRFNEAESRAAVELLERYLKEHPQTSVGIITLNRAQSDHIQDLLDQRLEASPTLRSCYEAAMERDLDARPFIRNLENVQGDERDVIILSVAYSASATGKVPLRFGALSQPGGERRLNVAVSRARRKMIVLCSFDPETQLVVTEQASQGAQVLKAYLGYARRVGGEAGLSQAGAVGSMPSAHAQVVDHLARELEAQGWKTDRSVGASAARVDLAVRSKVDPERYVLGILLDGPGAAWATSPVGREVGRVMYLERYFWPIHVACVRGWVSAREEALSRLLERLRTEEGKLDAVPGPPSVALLKASPGSSPPTPPLPKPTAKTRRHSPQPPKAQKQARPTGGSVSRPKPAPREAVEPGLVVPGSTVRYFNLNTEDEHEVTLAGPTVPRGVKVVGLNTPLAEALLDAVAGELAPMELDRGTVELKILEVRPPPRMPEL